MPASTKARASESGLSLTAQEVASLLGDGTPALETITGKIAGAYGENQLLGSDAKAAEQIFRLVLRDTDVPVRKTLAGHLKDSAAIPRDIVLTLVHDVAEVALPVLQNSPVLGDNDLIELIEQTNDSGYHIAISKRKTVSEIVSGGLLDKGNSDVAAILLQNSGARISDIKLTGIAAVHGDNDAIMQSLRKRPNLPLAIATALAPARAPEPDKGSEAEALKLVRAARSQEDIDRLVNNLLAFGRLTPSLILSALCHGDFRFFETSVARIANVPVANARTLINDRGDLGFKAIYNKSGLPESMFQAVRLLLKVTQALDGDGCKSDSEGYTDRVVELLLQQPAPVDNLSYIVALVRRTAA